MTPNEKVKAMREDKDMNQTELGKLLNKSQRTISRIENGETQLQANDIKQYCKLFNVSADYILELPQNLPYPKR